MSIDIKSVSKIISYLSREIVDKIDSLSDDEKRVLEYFLHNISVGTLVAIRELRAFYRIEDPKSAIRKLIDLGLLEQGYGCYSLSKSIREGLLKVYLQQTKHSKDFE
ncbi:MAG: hypothetical protein N3D82_03180 [Ignisphaera sp.]|nr:hypothetical protein [Ignisphaera sp.]MCX8168013.1 hypothetical protein [Ignisphaera sp.]MDW8085516.1 hypothetical protein [Ignisphaera sp.]